MMQLDSVASQIYLVAMNEAKLQSHEYVTPEHLLYSALMFDIGKDIIENSGGYATKISGDLQRFFDKYIPKTENGSPIQSFAFIKLFELASAQAANSEKGEITVTDLLSSLMTLPECYAVYILRKNGVERLPMLKYISHGLKEKQRLQNIAKQSSEQRDDNNHKQKPAQKTEQRTERRTEAEERAESDYLRAYAVNLTERAQKGLLDPVVGRNDIMERTIQVLCRRVKNNPVHVGDAGVGKTAVVEGLAQRIVAEDVPEKLKGAQIFEIDMGGIIAGTKYRGDFEERLIKVLTAVEKEPNAIVYLDEIHNIVGAGAVSGGGMDATSILKPYLTKGGLRFIGATTYEEFKKYFEKDSALTRRFQKIELDEPSIDEAAEVLEGIKHKYESFHNVLFGTDIIKICCGLAGKYINDRKLPDKAIDVIDETGAFLRMNAIGEDVITVTERDIERTIAQMAKIPERSVSANEAGVLRGMEETLKERIFGQDKAVSIIVNSIKAARSGLNEPDKPVASLLFVGPTGVGKTEIARQLAEIMSVKLLRFDMSEYQEQHSVARLIGSPPGYVGYENGGLLTDEIRKTPHCVLLLDEIEKAHPDVFNVLLQVMDYGTLTDNTGKKADFRNVILIMTSNAGAREMGKRVIGYDGDEVRYEAIDKEVERTFSPEFRNRLDEIVPFNHIDAEMARRITKRAIEELAKKVDSGRFTVNATDEAVEFIAGKGLSKIFGAREIMRIINKDLKKQLADILLFDSNESSNDNSSVVISMVDGEIKVVKE